MFIVTMETPNLTRQDATCSVLYKIDLVRCCRYNEHEEQRIGGEPESWYRNLSEAVEHYSLWFHEIGHIIWFGDIASCCKLKIRTRIKKCD